MQLNQAISLISHPAINKTVKSAWADLGCGDGLFSYALANILQPGSTIHAVDKNKLKLSPQTIPEQTKINSLQLDFINDDLPFSDLDGILMANSFHYVKDKSEFIRKLEKHLKSSPQFLIVEYDTENANQWVPYPIGFKSLEKLFINAGYSSIIKINEMPSVFRREMMYGALIDL